MRLLFSLLLAIYMVLPSFAQKTAVFPFDKLRVNSGSVQVTVVSYNCENLFDCRHDTLKHDYEFLPEAQRHWTRGRYWRKINDIGRVILSCGGEGQEWRLPDIVGLVEVENDSVLLRLIRGSVLREAGYRYVMTDSRDRRGVDVALLYNPLTVRLLSADTLRVMHSTGSGTYHSTVSGTLRQKGQRPTRDILHATLELRSGDTLHVFVVHAPSRAGGQSITDSYRQAVTRKIMEAAGSLRNVIVMGDFNDYSYNKSLKYLRDKGLTDVSEKAVGLYHPEEVTGTYYYQKEWGSLDHIFVSPFLLRHVAEDGTKIRRQGACACYIQDKEWMLERDRQGHLKPYRTYLGTFYHGGVSDHLPLVLCLEF